MLLGFQVLGLTNMRLHRGIYDTGKGPRIVCEGTSDWMYRKSDKKMVCRICLREYDSTCWEKFLFWAGLLESIEE